MNFLSRLLSRFGASSASRESLPSDPDRNEFLARFLVSKKLYSIEKSTVKPAAFLPATGASGTSVFRVRGLSEAEIWNLASKHVERAPDRRAKARAQLSVEAVLAAELRLVTDNTPPRHADISNWPSDKDSRLMVAVSLAQSCQLIMRDSDAKGAT